MIPYDGFKERYYGSKKNWRGFTDEEKAEIERLLPEDVSGFLLAEGLSSYGNNFLWTTHPGLLADVLDAWGLKQDKCFAFMRSAFGACIYYAENEYFYLDPLFGRIVSMDDNFYLALNYSLTIDEILENGFFLDVFNNLEMDTAQLKPDEILAFIPALPMGGSFETSKVEKVKMAEHLMFLAQLFEGKAKKV
ncbi:MAG: DUF1851 domain-containing protein [Bacteroidetes bacterium]|nr:MAG: DUF1851 domain-containing protein [Bacteroidota bacterium]